VERLNGFCRETNKFRFHTLKALSVGVVRGGELPWMDVHVVWVPNSVWVNLKKVGGS